MSGSLTTGQLLDPLARMRTDEVVVTTMSVTRPWGRISDSDLDFASADSAMGHAADLALGSDPEDRILKLSTLNSIFSLNSNWHPWPDSHRLGRG